MNNTRTKIILALVLLVAALVPVAAQAGRPHVRDGWLIGLGYGYGRGAITLTEVGDRDFEDGATPQIRFGRAISSRFTLSAEYSGWMLEGGNLEGKLRSSMQDVLLALTWYPGHPESAWGGFYVRAGAGYGWGRFAVVELDEDLHHGESQSLDENGLGLQGVFGYEWRIAHGVAAGLSGTVNHLDIGGDFYDKATYGSVAWTLNYYWD